MEKSRTTVIVWLDNHASRLWKDALRTLVASRARESSSMSASGLEALDPHISWSWMEGGGGNVDILGNIAR